MMCVLWLRLMMQKEERMCVHKCVHVARGTRHGVVVFFSRRAMAAGDAHSVAAHDAAEVVRSMCVKQCMLQQKLRRTRRGSVLQQGMCALWVLLILR